MLQINKSDKLNAQAILSQLMQRKQRTTAPRFKLPYTQEQVYTMLYASCCAEVRSRHRQFQATPSYTQHLTTIAQWLTDTATPTFGLFLCGNRGNGKSTIVRALQSLLFWLRSAGDTPADPQLAALCSYTPGFDIITAKELVRLAKAYNNPTRDNRNDYERYKRILNIEILAIDDLGAEPSESIHYGDYVTASKDIISHRYNLQLTTIATSNLAPDEIKGYYDERIADRFREMMLIIDFGNEPSFRSTK